MTTSSKPWFGQKRFGMGLGPATWQGWLALILYVMALGWSLSRARLLFADQDLGEKVGWGLSALLTVALLALIVIKGDRRPWRWRWGGKD